MRRPKTHNEYFFALLLADTSLANGALIIKAIMLNINSAACSLYIPWRQIFPTMNRCAGNT